MNSVTVTVLLTDLLGIHQHSINMVRFVRFTFAAFFVCSILYFTQVAGVIDIVPPYPINPVVIEGENAELTCVAYDIENKTKPENMTFLKIINTFGDTKPIPDGGNYTFTKKTELSGLRIVVTMVIKKMYADMAGVYRCQADRPKEGNRTVRPAAHEFRVHYVAQKSLPQLNYSSNVTTEFGKPASLYCELVQGDQKVSTNIVKLDKIAWFKNDVSTGNEVARLDEKLPNINLKMDSPSDAGKYTCQLFTTLYLTRKYNISGNITVAIKPRFPPLSSSNVGDDGYEITLDENEIIRKKGESAKFNCIAEGNPITIIWKKTLRSSEKTEVLNQTALTKNGSSSRYKFSNDDMPKRLKGFWMEIPETNFDDRGEYSCCVEIDNNQRCQKFTLRVKDPLGWLWPLIGIIIQAILIVLILVIAHCCKSGGAKSKPVKQTDLSYTFTDDGGKGHIRLRNTGARTG